MVNTVKPGLRKRPTPPIPEGYSDQERAFMEKAEEGKRADLAPKGRGRPKEDPKVKILLSMPTALAEKVDAYRDDKGDGQKRPSAIVSIVADYFRLIGDKQS
ncbi:hypothetical protein [Flexibacterium corallicola]|uniref:hypothetical protein n=1 Tax=Flexibacterium corallicola TaxID=3037259 RepID=UPI00286F9938|nr:hypothetical protein [Pseudovibrio sp. M1P-2-3]